MTSGQIVTRQEAMTMTALSTTVRMASLMESPVLYVRTVDACGRGTGQRTGHIG